LGTGIETWQNLVKTARVAIANPKNSYKVLAPLIIKELKDAGDLVQGGKVKGLKRRSTNCRNRPLQNPGE
jgi:hypothetical protein